MTVGKWFVPDDSDALRGFYAAVLPVITLIARQLGYTVAVHGDKEWELNIIAAAWQDQHSGHNALLGAMQKAACGRHSDRYEGKPHPCGRVSYKIPLGERASLGVSLITEDSGAVAPVRKMPLPADDTASLKGEIEYGAFANPYFRKVLRRFGKTAFARSSACMEMEAFIKRLGVRGKVCLEIGTYQGMSAVILSQFFDKVICVSVDDDPRRIIKREIIDFLQIKNIEFHDCRNNAKKHALVSGLEFDFAYSDGDHAHDTLEDFELVKRCGRVLMHEYWPIQPPVWNLVNSLPQHEVTRAQHDCFAYWEQGSDNRRGGIGGG